MQPVGPFFKNKHINYSKDMTNNKKAKGEIIQVKGKVLDKNCNPYSFTTVYIWQANTYGKYNHKHDISKNKIDYNFNGYTKIKTDKYGFYKFITIMPGGYKVSNDIIRPPHIHLFITTKNNKKLSTQLYVKDHPLNKKDFLFNTIKKSSLLELDFKKASSDIKKAYLDIII
tara:strand:+ start:90 stop:602 length:513 start_codon:yes stop_codon:yes gene_type:complete